MRVCMYRKCVMLQIVLCFYKTCRRFNAVAGARTMFFQIKLYGLSGQLIVSLKSWIHVSTLGAMYSFSMITNFTRNVTI